MNDCFSRYNVSGISLLCIVHWYHPKLQVAAPAVGIGLPEIVSWVTNVEFWHKVSVECLQFPIPWYMWDYVCWVWYFGSNTCTGMYIRLSKKYLCLRYVDFITNVGSRVCKQLTCRHLSQSAWDLSKSFCPARSRVSHHAHIIAHVTKVFGQSDTWWRKISCMINLCAWVITST